MEFQVFKAAAKLFSGGIAGKILGLVRELLLAGLFGTRAEVDAFRAAQTGIFIPSHFLTTDWLNASFIPLYSRYQGEEEAKARAVFWMLTVLMGGASILLAIAVGVWADSWMRLLVPGFSPKAMKSAVVFVKIMAIGMPFYVQSTLFSYLGMANARYALASIRATVENVGVMAGILAAFIFMNPALMAIGFTGAYIVYFFIGCALMAKAGCLRLPDSWVRPQNKLLLYELWKVIQPVLLLPLIVQGNFLFERVVASLIGRSLQTDGVVAALGYARTISETGLVLVAWPIGLAGLTALSKMSSEAALVKLKRLLPILLTALIPISVYMAVYSMDIVRVLYGRGEFLLNQEESVHLTQQVFLGLAAGFWTQVTGFVLFRALNALMRNRELAVFMALGFAVNIVANFLAFRLLGPLALGISASIGGLLMLALSARALSLGRTLARFLEFLLPGAAIYAAIALLAPWTGLARLVAGAVLFAVYWGIWIRCMPPLWAVARDVMQLVKPPADETQTQ